MPLLRITERPRGMTTALICELPVVDSVGTHYINVGQLYLETWTVGTFLAVFDPAKVEIIRA